jgi:hypothetical protein
MRLWRESAEHLKQSVILPEINPWGLADNQNECLRITARLMDQNSSCLFEICEQLELATAEFEKTFSKTKSR